MGTPPNTRNDPFLLDGRLGDLDGRRQLIDAEPAQIPNPQRRVRDRISRFRITFRRPAAPIVAGRRQHVRFDRADVDPQHRQPIAVRTEPESLVVPAAKDLFLIRPIQNAI